VRFGTVRVIGTGEETDLLEPEQGGKDSQWQGQASRESTSNGYRLGRADVWRQNLEGIRKGLRDEVLNQTAAGQDGVLNQTAAGQEVMKRP
jgi:hypothetical protein